MTTTSLGKSNAATLDELVALNDEIAALIRAGMPLEAGLAHMGRQLPGRLGDMSERLAERLQAGQTLAQALGAEGERVPEVYRAVVEAGLRAGRLPVALEGLSTAGRRITELRRVTGAALLYPMLVVLVAWGLFCLFAGWISQGYAVVPETHGPALSVAAAARPWLWILGPLVPAVVLASVFVWALFSRRAARLRRGGWSFLPGRARLTAYGHAAAFSEILALLVEHGVPLPEGLRLATRATSDARLESAGRNLAAALQAGQSLEACGDALADLPPLARWLLISAQSPAALAGGLRQAATSYRHMAQRVADRAQIVLPLLFTGVFGAGATFIYVLIVYSPYLQMLWSLATKH